ncbi:MAG: hypothetical protein KBH23_01815 [Bacteroidaceae bacterium]|nr:hypothetical protein [Bacteroidaceae bacterium]
MKDFLPLVVIIGIIVFKIIKARQEQQRQEADREMESSENPYIGDETAPLPERRKRLSEIPRASMSTPSHSQQASLAINEPASILHPSAHSTMHTPTKKEKTSPVLSSAECENEYEIHSLEEAKRAFVYSEIFTRKY